MKTLTFNGTLGITTSSYSRRILSSIATASSDCTERLTWSDTFRKNALDGTPDTVFPVAVPIQALSEAKAILIRTVNQAKVRFVTVKPGSAAAVPAVPIAVDPLTTAHSSDGTGVTIATVGTHGLLAGDVVELAGWTWSDGGGVVDGIHSVFSVPTSDTFVLVPYLIGSICPTTGTNPSVVGTAEIPAVPPIAEVEEEHEHLLGEEGHPEGVYVLFGPNAFREISVEDVEADGTTVEVYAVGD